MVVNTNGQIAISNNRPIRISDELIALLRERVASQYYDHPEVVEVVARAILLSREIYP
jgi:hypothetical protein